MRSRIDSHTLPAAPENPTALVEKFLMEQPEKQRPEAVNVTPEYLEYTDATWHKSGAWLGRDASKQKVVRIYYASIVQNYLYEKGRFWIVRTRNKRGSLLADIWTDSEDAARATWRPWMNCSGALN